MNETKNRLNNIKAKELIELNGVKTSWLANRCEVGDETVRKYLRGELNPSRAVVALMALALGCDKSELLNELNEAA